MLKMEYYNDYGMKYYKELYNNRNNSHFYSTLSNILKLIGNKKGKILDIGCGSGRLGMALRTLEGCKIIGIDRNINAVNFCNSNGYESYQMSCDNIILNDKFDIILCSALVEHIPDDVYLKMLNEIKRILNKDGILIIYTPNPNSILEKLNKKEEHIGLKSMNYLEETLNKNGYKIEKSYFASSHIPLFRKRRICIRASLKNEK